MYLVEMVQVNRVVKVKKQTDDYDAANTAFRALKKEMYKELRMFRVGNDEVRVLLKYVVRGRGSGFIAAPA